MEEEYKPLEIVDCTWNEDTTEDAPKAFDTNEYKCLKHRNFTIIGNGYSTAQDTLLVIFTK